MTGEGILPQSVRAFKPGLVGERPAECRPRPSAADLRIPSVPGEVAPDSPPRKVIDYTAVKFPRDASLKQICDYYRRRRHRFGWKAYRNESSA